MPELATWQWALGMACALFTGIAKTGVPGAAIVVVPLMVVTTGDARASAAWLLPMLMTGDLFAIYAWRKQASKSRLIALAPWVLAGMSLGAAALGFPESTLRPVIGTIIVVMFAMYLLRRFRPGTLASTAHPAPYGAAAGFATTVANAAGPVMNLYLLGQNLPKEEFIRTGAWFFFLVNLTKVPIYLYHGLFTARSVTFDLMMAPLVIVGALSGKWILSRMSARGFEWMVIALTAAAIPLLFR